MAFLKMTAGFRPMLFDECIVATAGCEDVSDTLVDKAGEHDATCEERLVQGIQGTNVYLICHLESLAVFVNLFQMG